MFLAKKLNKGAGTPVALDAQFNYVTMLLHGDGTNGAQNNTFLDSSTNNFTITRNGNTTQGSFSPYGSNWGVYFGGVGNYLTTATSASGFSFGTSDFTVEFWINSTQTTRCDPVGQDTLFTASGWWGFIFNLSGSGNMAWYENANSRISASGTNWNNGQWNHVAVTRSGNDVKMFLNGTQVGSTYTTSFTYGASSVGIINGVISDGKTDGAMTGYLSNVRIVKGTAVYTSSFTPSTTPLTAISGTSLLINQSNRFIDNSTNALAITTTGTPSVQRFNPFGASTAYSTSVIGGSGYFDGSGDYLVVGNAVDLDGVNYTVEFWFAGSIFELSWGTAGGYCPIAINSGGAVYFADSSNSTWQANVQNVIIKDGTWNHYAIVRQSGSTKIYRNGVLIGTPAAPSNNSPNGNVTIGLYNSGTQGYVSDLRAVVGTAVYTSAFTPPTAPLTAISGTQLLTNFTNGAIFDNAMMNDLETVGNAQISTSVYKYGTGSLAFDGTGDWLTCPLGPNLTLGASSDFTIECWFRANNFSTNVGCIYSSSAGTDYLAIRNSANLEWANGVIQLNYTIPSASTTTWYHLAVTRSGSTVRMFLNGSVVASGTDTSLILGSGTTFYIGNYAGNTGAGYSYNGYLDEFRITKGYARYTANFTAPTAAFPNIGPV